ncbi:MAG TPA: glycoside hydrolase family 15 protein [Actinomycetota bacterium]|jgi:alpha,alpha-trehalase|nr:glycoside hydrolase family 15 protein [Actinomycetota bacterium]
MEPRIEVSPVDRIDGYLAIEDHGLIGDGAASALVGRDGTIDWMCVPRLDSDPLFCSLLDHSRGGAFRLRPRGLRAAGHTYVPETGVLVTEMHGPEGIVRVTDAMTLRAGADLREEIDPSRRELLRIAEVVSGTVHLEVEVEPRGGGTARRSGSAFCLAAPRHPHLDFDLVSDARLDGPRTTLSLGAGDRVAFSLRWGGGSPRRSLTTSDERLSHTVDAWRRWTARLSYDGPQADLVTRSAVVLKMLDYMPNGAIVAAPTSSLPEQIGGERNWDYRYAWVRDAAFTVYALSRIGCHYEGHGFVAWILDVIEEAAPHVLYTLDGAPSPPERHDEELEGYRGSSPVRWGNAAGHQTQHDAYGEILDCAYQWAHAGGEINPELWNELAALADAAALKWGEPDHGIWEVRTSGRPFTYSAAMCHVAVDRAARMVEMQGHPGDADRWRKTAKEIQEAILEQAWDEEKQSLVEHLGPGGIDASLLALPLRRVLDARHPRMVATARSIASRLDAGGGLLYRYDPAESPDGLHGHEGAFLLCSFWLADNLVHQGRVEEASDLFDSLCARTNPLGLLSEEVDPSSGAFLGNFPQAFSHVGLISTGVNLGRATR